MIGNSVRKLLARGYEHRQRTDVTELWDGHLGSRAACFSARNTSKYLMGLPHRIENLGPDSVDPWSRAVVRCDDFQHFL